MRERDKRERRDWQKRVSTRRQLYKGMLFRCVLTSLSVSFLSFNLHLQMFGSFVSFSLSISLSPSLHGWNSYIYRRKKRKHAVVCSQHYLLPSSLHMKKGKRKGDIFFSFLFSWKLLFAVYTLFFWTHCDICNWLNPSSAIGGDRMSKYRGLNVTAIF